MSPRDVEPPGWRAAERSKWSTITSERPRRQAVASRTVRRWPTL